MFSDFRVRIGDRLRWSHGYFQIAMGQLLVGCKPLCKSIASLVSLRGELRLSLFFGVVPTREAVEENQILFKNQLSVAGSRFSACFLEVWKLGTGNHGVISKTTPFPPLPPFRAVP